MTEPSEKAKAAMRLLCPYSFQSHIVGASIKPGAVLDPNAMAPSPENMTFQTKQSLFSCLGAKCALWNEIRECCSHKSSS